MGRWRDAALSAREPVPVASVAVETFGLPASLAADIRRLDTLRPPTKLADASNWQPIIDDALRLAREGWAATALSLGWSVGDLYGVGPTDSGDFEGLAVWLRGRRLVLLDERLAIAEGNPADYRSTFVRGGMGHGTHPVVQPVMLWEFGR